MTAVIVSDEAIRTTVVYDPDADELTDEDAITTAKKWLDQRRWVFIGCDRIGDSRVAVRFRRS